MTNEILHALRAETKHSKNTILSGNSIYTDSEGNSLTVEATISGEMYNDTSLENKVLLKEDHSILQEAIKTLSPREQEVIKRRYGIDCEPETQNDIAISLGMSQANVSKIEQSILKKLHTRIRSSVDLEESDYYTDLS